jgi:hypothetical protein
MGKVTDMGLAPPDDPMYSEGPRFHNPRWVEAARTSEAMKTVRERGFLNQFSTMADTWFIAHSVPGGSSADAVEIEPEMANYFIRNRLVVEVGRAFNVMGDGSLCVWFAPRDSSTKP